jgi:2,3-bisphosphoglycerate-independent phosphoglycerate mutase
MLHELHPDKRGQEGSAPPVTDAEVSPGKTLLWTAHHPKMPVLATSGADGIARIWSKG